MGYKYFRNEISTLIEKKIFLLPPKNNTQLNKEEYYGYQFPDYKIGAPSAHHIYIYNLEKKLN